MSFTSIVDLGYARSGECSLQLGYRGLEKPDFVVCHSFLGPKKASPPFLMAHYAVVLSRDVK